jgi:hypothetical protein
MLKFFFWIVLLANAGLLAFQQGYLDTLFPSGREPGRVNNQLNPDKIRLLPAGAVAPAPVPAVSAASTTATAVAPPPVSDAVMSAISTARKPDTLSCADIGNFSADEAKRFSAQLAPLSLGDRLAQRSVQEIVSHLVYIPPQGDKEGADKKAGELRRLGITDFYVIQDNSPLRWGISLGVFKTEEAARGHLVHLNQKGVRTARIGQRNVAANLVAFRLKDLDAGARNAVEKIKAGFPKQEMKGCEAV